jgi:flagellar basal-body rod protein FlgB
MIGEADAVTLNLVKLALDAAVLNQKVIANNIANAGTPGYVPYGVNFAHQLDALRETLQRGGDLNQNLLLGVQPVVERLNGPGVADQQVQMDMEVAKLAENTVMYQVLLRALGKQMSILGSAISEGKR